MPDLLPENVRAINLLSRINVLGAKAAFELTDWELSPLEAEALAQKLMMLKELEYDIAERNQPKAGRNIQIKR